MSAGTVMPENETALPEKTNDSSTVGRAPGARLALALLLSINMFNFIDRYVLAAVEPAIENEFFPKDPVTGQRPADTKQNMGWLPFAFMVAYMLIAPLFGWLGDRMSRWTLVGVGVILWTVTTGASGWAPTFMILLLTRCFVGIGEAAYGPVAPTIISDLYPVKKRGYVLAWFYMAIPVGSALGYVLGGLIWKITGDWRWAFYVVVPPGLLLGLWAFWMRDPRRGAVDSVNGEQPRTAQLKDYLIILRTPSYVLNTLGMTALTFAMGGIAYWMPGYIVEKQKDLDLGYVGMVFGGILVVSGLVATMAGGIVGDKLRDRFPGAYFQVSGIAMLVGFPMVLLVVALPFPWAWIFVFLSCFCLFFNTGPTNTIIANVTHPSLRASAFALNILVIHALGDAFSPMLIGRIADRWSLDLGFTVLSGLNLGFTVVSLMILVGGVLWLWGARYLQRDTELAPTRLTAA